MEGRRVLVIEGDDEVMTLLRGLYGRHEAEVVEATNGADGLEALDRDHPDLVVLDDAMPDLDGSQMLERIRRVTDVPLLILSARDHELEKVRALRAGADDYVTKPFGREELLARSEALLRRASAEAPPRRYVDGALEVDFDATEARVDGRPLALSPLEFRLLGTFLGNPNRVLSQDQLLQTVWGDPGLSRDRVKIYVGYVRSKLRAAGVPDAAIETVRGFGYRFRPRA